MDTATINSQVLIDQNDLSDGEARHLNTHEQLLPAFTDEVNMAQQTFRQVLTAMSEPARIMQITADPTADKLDDNHSQQQPHKLTALWAVAQTLLDNEVSVFVDASLPKQVPASIRFYTGAKLTATLAQAQYVFVNIKMLSEWVAITNETTNKTDNAAHAVTPLNNDIFNTGTLEKPHTAATIIVLAPNLYKGDTDKQQVGKNAAQPLFIDVTGPGVPSKRHIGIDGFNISLLSFMQDNAKAYPCGVDWIFCAGEQLLALPRTSQISKQLN